MRVECYPGLPHEAKRILMSMVEQHPMVKEAKEAVNNAYNAYQLTESKCSEYVGYVVRANLRPELEKLNTDFLTLNNRPRDVRCVLDYDISTKELFELFGLRDTCESAYKVCANDVPGLVLKAGNVVAIPKVFNKIKEQLEVAFLMNRVNKIYLLLLEEHGKAQLNGEEEKFFKSLKFDWHYSYSDSGSVYRNGSQRHSDVTKATLAAIEANPKLRVIAENVSMGAFGTKNFFTNTKNI